jgi:hypothetical protein
MNGSTRRYCARTLGGGRGGGLPGEPAAESPRPAWATEDMSPDLVPAGAYLKIGGVRGRSMAAVRFLVAPRNRADPRGLRIARWGCQSYKKTRRMADAWPPRYLSR